MKQVNHPACNDVLGKPKGSDDVDSLHIMRGVEDGYHTVTSFWRPEPGELELLQRGGYIKLTALGVTHPPVRLEVEPFNQLAE